MTQVRSDSEPTAASLVGSLSSFPLLDVLELLARTGRTGELQVVGQGLDRRVWVDRGDLVDTSGTGSPDTGLFEMACIEEGWFYFTLADSTPEATGRAPIPSVLEALSSQVGEWNDLVSVFPFDAMVRMSSTTPADEVQIRADQWQLLSLVGAGSEVHEVLSSSSLHPLDTLRTLRELTDGQLVAVERPAPGAEPARTAAPEAGGEQAAAGEQGARPDEPAPRAEPDPSLATADGNGSGGPAIGAAAVPVAVEGDASASDSGAASGDAPLAPPAGDRDGTPDTVQGPVMPPPISGDPWSSSLATPAATESHAGDQRS